MSLTGFFRYAVGRARAIKSPRDLARRLKLLGKLGYDLARGRYGWRDVDFWAFFASDPLVESPVRCDFCGAESPAFVVRAAPDPALLCPRCGSIGRWRVFARYFADETAWLSKARRALALSRTPMVEDLLKKAFGGRLTTVDIAAGPGVDVVADAQKLPFPDETFDLIVHSHVLEHVADDVAALGEMHRVLAPGGRVVLNVPFENPMTGGIVQPREIGAALFHGAGERHNRVQRCYSIAGFHRRLRERTPFKVRRMVYEGLAYHRSPFRGLFHGDLVWELRKD